MNYSEKITCNICNELVYITFNISEEFIHDPEWEDVGVFFSDLHDYFRDSSFEILKKAIKRYFDENNMDYNWE